MSQGKIIAISGGPRTGKSTLVKFLSEKLDATPFFEGEEKDFPPRVLEDIKSGNRVLELILWFRNKLVKEYMQALELKKKGKIVILDTFWATNDVYVDEWVSDEFEKDSLMELAKLDYELLPWPDLVIALNASNESIRDFAIKGGRTFEQTEEFFKKQINLSATHERYFRDLDKPNVKFVNAADISYERKETLDQLVANIKKWC